MRFNLVWPIGLLLACSCAPEHYRVSVLRSLRPVDTARAMVVFGQIQGEACGRDAVLGAIRDMKRLGGVDGYLEVVVEMRGTEAERCAKVTAFPFRYGTSTEAPQMLPTYQEAVAQRVPGRDTTPEPPTTNQRCQQLCDLAASVLEQESLARGYAADSCRTRCLADPTLLHCLEAPEATTQRPAAQACLHAGGSP